MWVNLMLSNNALLKLCVCILGAALFATCQSAESQTLPDTVLKRVTNEDGASTLQGWNEVKGPRITIPKILTPQGAEFSGARLFYESSLDSDARSATEKVLGLNGFTRAQYKTSHATLKSFIKTIDGHKNADVTIFFYEGRLDGKPAKAITYTWSGKVLCGDDDFCNVVHTFMAPSDQFESLGGGAVLAVAWLEQDVPQGVTSMKKYGAVPAKDATQKLAQYVNSWASTYLKTHVQMMQMLGQNTSINQQVIDNMQSYNNALAQCGGWDCSISQGGNGMWTATPD